MERPRLIVTDLDGTLLGPDGSVSPLNREATARAAALGIPFVVATGRPIRWLEVLDGLGSTHPLVVASNGAVLWDLAAGAVVEYTAIETGCAAALLGRLRAGVPGIYLGLETVDGFRCEPGTPTRERVPEQAITTDLLDCAEPVLKLLGFHPDLGSAELTSLVAELVGDLATVTHSALERPGLVEISAPGVSKATALVRLCDRLGIAGAQVAAFGDMPNDAAMLAWAGAPHVVANAHPSLLAAGFRVVGGNADSGVGRRVLELLD
ncbi:MAG: HAD hydrolase family protein [Propionicimonas sp.]